ncbi:MAG: hypothetical protein FH756_00235 [Firmicutes bacterium]|nr:hypothetical protein [Bacillota bacterium]
MSIAKNMLKAKAKQLAKQGMKKFILWLVGAVGAPTLIITGVVLLLFIIIYGAVASSEEGPDSIAVSMKPQYEEKVAEVNPNNGEPKSTRADLERKHFLKWGTILALDFFRAQIENKEEVECKVDELAPELAPIYTYEKSTIVTVTKRKVTKTDPETGKKSTHWETDRDVDDVYLLVEAKTFRGNYEYEYERKTTRHSSPNRKVTKTRDKLSGTNYIPDWSTFDEVLRRELHVDKVTMDERTVILEAGLGFTEQEQHFDWLLGNYRQPGAVLAECPEEYRELFREAGEKYGVPWYVLMALAKTESSFQPDKIGDENYTGELAEGLMQFLPSTWAAYGIDANNDGEANPFDPADAIYSAAYYLNELGWEENEREALYGYNHSWQYVDHVLELADQYHDQKVLGSGGYYYFPVDWDGWWVTAHFGADRGDHTHTGVDIAAPSGTPLRAVIGGTVKISASDRALNDIGGRELWLLGDDGNNYYYAHLSGYATSDGQKVNASQVVGYVGSTGRSTGPHLHFGLIIPSQGSHWINPGYLFDGLI